MGDGSAIGGWLLAAAVVAVLAGGVGAASAGSGDADRETGSGSTPGATTGTSTSADRARATTGGATVRAAPCTRIATIRTGNGARYHEFPVNAAGSPLCLLKSGNSGRPVTVLQRALLRCSDRTIRVTGMFDGQTVAAIRRQQTGKVGQMVDGVYGPITATTVRWPWIDTSSGRFTGSCARAGARS